MVNKLKVKLQEENNPFCKVLVEDRFGNKRYIHMHGYLLGMEAAFQLKKENKLHNLVIITGSVGSGKSSLTQGLAGINSIWNGSKLDFENVSWSTEKFIEKTDREDNIGTPQWWDESIQGVSGRNMAITSLGNKLKMAFVTKRFKKHTYYLLVDEINEYAWKLIKMSDAWINVRRFGLKRGYFDVFTNKSKIKFIYNAFKYFNKTWDSKIIKDINPDCKGKFQDFTDLFLSEEEYDRLKLEETKQLEETQGKVTWSEDQIRAFYDWCKGQTVASKLADKYGVHKSTMGDWLKKFKKVVGEKNMIY